MRFLPIALLAVSLPGCILVRNRYSLFESDDLNAAGRSITFWIVTLVLVALLSAVAGVAGYWWFQRRHNSNK